MIVSIHQPNFLPWLGYFYKIACSDVFVFLDNVAYSKNSYTNRSKIKTPQGPQWLTVPIRHHYQQLISEVPINNETDWRKKQLKTLEADYGKARYFREVFDILEASYASGNTENLCTLNVGLTGRILEYLEIRSKIVVASTLGVTGKATELLIAIVKAVGGQSYLSGFGGAQYQEEEEFARAGVRLTYYDFKHPVYDQLWGEFAEGLSIIDLLFSCGRDSRRILMGEGRTPGQQDI